MRVIVYHSNNGCETGCCGHRIELTDDAGKKRSEFEFAHPYWSGGPPKKRAARFKKFAEDLVRAEFGEEHVKDLDWENCKIVDD